eukprot:g933.t1
MEEPHAATKKAETVAFDVENENEIAKKDETVDEIEMTKKEERGEETKTKRAENTNENTFEENMELIFRSCPPGVGKSLSRKERIQHNLKSQSLAYGEVIPLNFYRKILCRVNDAKDERIGGSFYDLGSGTGVAIFAAALSGYFDSCVGVEILNSLHKQALENLERYKAYVLPGRSKAESVDIAFIREDLTLADFQDAKVVFCLSTCFTDDILASIRKKARSCQVGTWFVTVTHPLRCDLYRLVDRVECKMSFGSATVFLQQKHH